MLISTFEDMLQTWEWGLNGNKKQITRLQGQGSPQRMYWWRCATNAASLSSDVPNAHGIGIMGALPLNIKQ